MKAITVQPPWSWAIATGAKLVENRGMGATWRYRGPLLIHAGLRWSERGARDPRVRDLWRRAFPGDVATLFGVRNVPGIMFPGHVVAVANLVDNHPAQAECCGDSPWAEDRYTNADGSLVTGVRHLVLEDVEELDHPVRATGRLGLWTPDPIVVAQVGER